MQSNYVIETQQLTKRFGRQVVVDHLTLQVPRGSVFCLSRAQWRRKNNDHSHVTRPAG